MFVRLTIIFQAAVGAESGAYVTTDVPNKKGSVGQRYRYGGRGWSCEQSTVQKGVARS